MTTYGVYSALGKSRLLAPWVEDERRSAIYHCVSRVVDRRFVFGDEEREQTRLFLTRINGRLI